MKPIAIHTTNAGRKLTLPIQFMKFGVDEQEIVIPIRKRDRNAETPEATRHTPSEPPSNAPEDPA